jgi:RND family efflux transporter MFP subunit
MTTSPPDLSRLRIDRPEPASRGSGRGRLMPVLVVTGLVVLAVVAWALFAPRATEVRVALAVATGGGTLSSSGITANGYVVARTKASVSAKVFGRLAYLGVAEGSVVEKGAVIARLENNDYRAAVDAARARLDQLEIERDQAGRELARANQLHDEHVIADAELDDRSSRHRSLGAQVESARAQLEVARANLENTLVRAPFDGTVLRKDAEVGEIVSPSAAGGGLTRTAIVTMADLRTLEVEVDVNEAYIAQVTNGQVARITLDAYPDTSFAGRVRQVVPTADRQKATVQVKVAILDRDPRILPEMGAKVVFARDDRGAATAAVPRRVLVPGAAVGQASDGPRVWVVADGHVTARTVDVGPARGDQLEIRRGLDGGESVVLGAPAGLKEGARVRVRSS